jgi:hypothetical protein
MKASFLLILTLFSLSLNAQKVLVSDELNLRNDLAYDILGELKGRVLLFRQRSEKFEIQAFDENMRSTWNKEIELERRFPGVIGTNTTRDSFTIFYHHKEKGNTLLRADQFDPSANKRRSTLIKDYGYNFFTPHFEMVRSEDRSKVLFYYYERNTFNVVVFDNHHHQVLWENALTFEDYTEGIDLLFMQVGNDGRMYMVIEKDNFYSRREKHHFDLITFGPGSTVVGRSGVFMGDKVTYDVMFSLDNRNQRLVAAGFYFEKNVERAEGYYFVSIPVNNLLNPQVRYYPFDEDFVEDMSGKEARQNRGLTDLAIREIVLRKDGGILIIGEESRNSVRAGGGPTMSRLGGLDGLPRSTIDYYFNNIMLLSVHPNGEEHWKKTLYKKQYSQDDNAIYSSFFLFKTPQNVRLIFNDEIKFENTVSEYTVKGDGGNERHSLLSTELLKLRLRFRDALQIAADKVIVPSERRGQLRVAKIVL